MSSFRCSSFVHALGVLLVFALCTMLVLSNAHSVSANDQVRRVLLFNVVDESSSGMSGLGKMASDAMQIAIDEPVKMECTEFSRTSPMVRRASEEGRILPTQIESGPLSPQDAILIGQQIGVDTVVIASVQSYKTLPSPRSVEVIIAGQAYDITPNFSVETGDVVAKPVVAQAFGVVGSSRKVPAYTGSDRPLAREALDDAAYRVAKVLGGATISEVAKPKQLEKKSRSSWKWIVIAAVVGGAVWALTSSNDDDGGTVGAIPPTPLPIQVEGTDTIRLSWNEPTGTTIPVLQYQLQRKVNDGSWEYFGTGSSSDNVRGTTTYPDFDVSSGNTYKYQIRAVYEDLSTSIWVEFGGVSL